MGGHGAYIFEHIFGHLERAWQNILGFGQELCEDAMQCAVVGFEPLPGRQEIRRVAVADHAWQEEATA